MTIQPIVEGHGEVSAVPVLLRRLRDAAHAYTFRVNHPIRRKRSELVEELKLRTSVQLARATPECAGILIMLDADDDLACLIGPQLLNWARAEARGIPCEIVVANREYEAWFLGSLESLRGSCGIAPSAISSPHPENIRDAKGAVQAHMTPGVPYSPTAHQASLTAKIDFRKVYQACPSFQKLVRAFTAICLSAGHGMPEQWPPADWINS